MDIYDTMLNRQEALMPRSGRIRQTCSTAAKGKSHQCTDVGASSGRARLRFWYSDSQKNGVKGAMTWIYVLLHEYGMSRFL